jgi:hypothetical protein
MIEKSIEYITECRDIHCYWVEKIKSGEKTSDEIEIGGDIEWHQIWINKYNFVLKTLETMKNSYDKPTLKEEYNEDLGRAKFFTIGCLSFILILIFLIVVIFW